jgi:hypothetical protein
LRQQTLIRRGIFHQLLLVFVLLRAINTLLIQLYAHNRNDNVASKTALAVMMHLVKLRSMLSGDTLLFLHNLSISSSSQSPSSSVQSLPYLPFSSIVYLHNVTNAMMASLDFNFARVS